MVKSWFNPPFSHAFQARVRKILCGLGFSNAMIDGPVNVLPGDQTHSYGI
jgi:hypothetical protein